MLVMFSLLYNTPMRDTQWCHAYPDVTHLQIGVDSWLQLWASIQLSKPHETCALEQLGKVDHEATRCTFSKTRQHLIVWPTLLLGLLLAGFCRSRGYAQPKESKLQAFWRSGDHSFALGTWPMLPKLIRGKHTGLLLSSKLCPYRYLKWIHGHCLWSRSRTSHGASCRSHWCGPGSPGFPWDRVMGEYMGIYFFTGWYLETIGWLQRDQLLPDFWETSWVWCCSCFKRNTRSAKKNKPYPTTFIAHF